jgi:hypothetical protein
MFMQGDYTPPKPGENHQRHAIVHAGFVQSEYYAGMPKEYKELHTKHMRETEQLAYVEAAEKQKLGAGGPQQNV